MTRNRESDPKHIEVMLLGIFHMDLLWLADTDVESDDMLTAGRQAELRDLTDHLEAWHPDRIAVERPYDEIEAVNDVYGKYRSGEYAYDREETFPSSHSARDELESECRSEVVQVGFRLADRLGHDRVLPVDEDPGRPETDVFDDRTIDSARKVSVSVPDPEESSDEQTQGLASLSLLEDFERMNENEPRDASALMFDRAIRATGERIGSERFGSPVDLAYWYDRTLRMVHHVWRTAEPGDERVLLLVGTGLVRMLWHLFDQAPMFRPVNPLSYLS